jgi:hypothetical protein
MQREGVFREMRRHRFYEKPSDRATREKPKPNADRASWRVIGSQLAADPAKVVSVKEVGFAIFAKSQHQARADSCIRSIKRKRIAGSEIFVLCVQHLPIQWRKIVLLVLTAPQIRSNTKHRFAVAPTAGSECIPGYKEEPIIDNTQPTR